MYSVYRYPYKYIGEFVCLLMGTGILLVYTVKHCRITTVEFVCLGIINHTLKAQWLFAYYFAN